MSKGTHRVRNGAAGAGALREVKFWRFAGDVGPQEAARLTAHLRLARKDESSRNNRFACVLLSAFSFPLGHRRHHHHRHGSSSPSYRHRHRRDHAAIISITL